MRACRLIVERGFPRRGVPESPGTMGDPIRLASRARAHSGGLEGRSRAREGWGWPSRHRGARVPLWGASTPELQGPRGWTRRPQGWSSWASRVELGGGASLVRSGSVRLVGHPPLSTREGRSCVRDGARIAYFEVSSGLGGRPAPYRPYEFSGGRDISPRPADFPRSLHTTHETHETTT